MAYDLTLASKFDQIRESNEVISWVGKPHFFPYLFSGFPIMIFGFLWGAIDFKLFQDMIARHQTGIGIPFLLLHAFPFWGTLLYIGWLLLSFHNVVYALSNQRVLFRGGAF